MIDKGLPVLTRQPWPAPDQTPQSFIPCAKCAGFCAVRHTKTRFRTGNRSLFDSCLGHPTDWRLFASCRKPLLRSFFVSGQNLLRCVATRIGPCRRLLHRILRRFGEVVFSNRGRCSRPGPTSVSWMPRCCDTPTPDRHVRAAFWRTCDCHRCRVTRRGPAGRLVGFADDVRHASRTEFPANRNRPRSKRAARRTRP